MSFVKQHAVDGTLNNNHNHKEGRNEISSSSSSSRSSDVMFGSPFPSQPCNLPFTFTSFFGSPPGFALLLVLCMVLECIFPKARGEKKNAFCAGADEAGDFEGLAGVKLSAESLLSCKAEASFGTRFLMERSCSEGRKKKALVKFLFSSFT